MIISQRSDSLLRRYGLMPTVMVQTPTWAVRQNPLRDRPIDEKQLMPAARAYYEVTDTGWAPEPPEVV